jgi:[acyl-carrier-protein] S-malonyltransferase
MSALVTAGVLELDDAARLVAVRCSLMAGAPAGGAMGAVSGLTTPMVEALCAEVAGDEPLVVAVENAPRQVVVSGGANAVAACLAAAGRVGATRTTPLRTSNAFHSPLMAGCTAAWADAVAAAEFRPPAIPLVLGSCGAARSDPECVRAAVVAQLTGRVRWSDAVGALRAARPSAYVECGASRFLVSLVRAEDRTAATLSMADERIRSAIGALV